MCFKWASTVFEKKFNGCLKVFQGCFQGVSRKIKGCSERPSRVIQGRFKCIKKKFKGWQFQWCFKEVSRMLKDSVKCVPKKCQIKFQEFSWIFQWSFVFAILLLHGSHCCYPSRRRACFYLWGLRLVSWLELTSNLRLYSPLWGSGKMYQPHK